MMIAQEVALALRAALGGVRIVTRDEYALFVELRESATLRETKVSVISWSPITGGQRHEAHDVKTHQAGKNGKLEPRDPEEFFGDLPGWIAENTNEPEGLGPRSTSARPFKPPVVFCIVGCDAALGDEAMSGSGPLCRRALIEACRIARARGALVALVGRDPTIHGELSDELAVLRHGLPDKETVRPHVVDMLASVGITSPAQALVDDFLKAGQGLTLTRQLDAVGVALKTASNERRNPSAADVSAYKERELASGALLARRAKKPLSSLVGYAQLKKWLGVTHKAMAPAARRLGIPAPKGVLLAGPPGTGKSRLCEATAGDWNIPWLTFDVARVFQSYIGESESAMRDALETATRMSPCVLQLDEVDTAFAKRSGPDVDGGTSRRIFGTFLHWLADKDDDVFVMMTSNRPHDLDPALIRSGRLDKIFFVDLPDTEGRRAIWAYYLKKAMHVDGVEADFLDRLVSGSAEFAPGEIENVVVEAQRTAFAQDRNTITLVDVATELASTIPIARSMAEAVTEMRTWASTNARPA